MMDSRKVGKKDGTVGAKFIKIKESKSSIIVVTVVYLTSSKYQKAIHI